MTKVDILSDPSGAGKSVYRAIAGSKQSVGRTAGEALDALTADLPPDEAGTLVVVQHRRPDRFFTAQQQKRLAELMIRWRFARDTGGPFAPADQAELDALIEAEVHAASERTAALLREIEG